MKCRGKQMRETIMKEYELEPIAHIKLLKGQEKHSDAEARITDSYYLFQATNKQDGTVETIQCGMGAAKDFLKQLNHSGLPIFNPLKAEERPSASDKRKAVGTKTESYPEWDPTARELYHAIMWLIIAWDAKPNTPLYAFKADVEKNKKFDPYDWKIKRVNTVIANGGKGKTLTDIVEGFRKDNDIRDSLCEFSRLQERMATMTDQEGNQIKSYF